MTARSGRATVVLARPDTGGPASVAASCARELRRRQVPVLEVVLPERGWRAARALLAVIRSSATIRRAGVVQVELGINAVSSFWFLVWAGFLRKDILAVLHDAPVLARYPTAGVVPERAGPVDAVVHRLLVPLFDKPLTNWARRRVGRFAVLSSIAAAHAEADGLTPVVVVRHGADEPVPGPSAADGSYVLLAGYLGPGKGLETLAEAWAVVGVEMTLPLRIAGTAARTNQAWLDDQRRRFDRLPQPPTWLGWLDDDQFHHTIAHAGIVVIPYDTSNPASGILTRAKVQGRAIVATRVPAVLGEVADGDDAILVDPGDPRALGTALLELAQHPDRRERLGRKVAARAASEHSWRRHIEDLYMGYGVLDGDER